MNNKIMQSVIFNTMRILKQVNPGDLYYEAYKGHLAKDGDAFYDLYMLLWEIGAERAPRRILEIGTRTGISLCQLLSAYIDLSVIEKIVCIDPFSDPFLSPALVKRNLKYLNLPHDKVEFLVGYSKDFLPEIEAADETLFDYILVDGDHSKETALDDLEHAHNLVAPGGVICFDDISDAPGECALIDVWCAFKEAHENDYEFRESMVGKGVAWAIRKK